MTVVTGNDPAQAAAAMRASIEAHQRQALTRAVEALEDAPINAALLDQAQRVKGALDAAHTWTDSSPWGAARGIPTLLRLTGGYDSKQGLYSRVAAVRSAAMSKLGRTAGGATVSKQAPASVADRVVDFVLYGDTDARTASGLASATVEGAREGAAEGLRNLREAAGDALDTAKGAVPWLAVGVGVVVALVVIVKVLR